MFLPDAFAQGLGKIIPPGKLNVLLQGLADNLNVAKLNGSELAASRWLSGLGHVALFSDNSLKLIIKNLKKQGIKLDGERVVDFVAAKNGNQGLLLMVESKTGLCREVIENTIGDPSKGIKSKFEATK